MIKRSLSLLLALTLLLALAAGCSSGSSEDTAPKATEGSPADSDAAADTGSEPAGSADPVKLSPETDGEKQAMTLAQSDEARKWASGDWQNGIPVAGDPFLAGYGVLVHDGTTQYQVTVLDGEVVGFFGKNAPLRYVEAPFANYNPTIVPDSARQTKAFDAAKTEIASVNPAATQGGIEFYVVFYPPQTEGWYPQVCIYASPIVSDSPWAMGGSFGWQ